MRLLVDVRVASLALLFGSACLQTGSGEPLDDGGDGDGDASSYTCQAHSGNDDDYSFIPVGEPPGPGECAGYAAGIALSTDAAADASPITFPVVLNLALPYAENACFAFSLSEPTTLTPEVVTQQEGCERDLELFVLPSSLWTGGSNWIYGFTSGLDRVPALFMPGDYALCVNQGRLSEMQMTLTVTADAPPLVGACASDGAMFIAESNEAVAALGSCTSFGGHLLLTDGVTDLSPLGNLTHIEHLELRASVTSLEGLSSLTDLPGGLSLIGTDLQSLAGAPLKKIGGRLDLYGNAALPDLSALSDVTFSGDLWLRIAFNHVLADLVGLEGLAAVTGRFEIFQNDGLRSLDGLGSLQQVGEWVQIMGNGSLPCCVAEGLVAQLEAAGGLPDQVAVVENAGNQGCE